MSEEKKVFVQNAPSFKVYNAAGDLSKKWFVYWYEGKKRIRKYGNINKFDTIKGRRSEARRLINQLKRANNRKVSVLEENLWKYLQENKNTWSFKTHQQYKTMTQLFLQYVGGRELNQQIVDAFFSELKQSKHPSTYNRYLGYFKRVLQPNGYDHLLEHYKNLKSTASPDRYYQEYQKKQLIKHIAGVDEQLLLFIQFMYYTFIRSNELRLLRVQDIYFAERQIRVPQSVKIGGEQTRVSKNNKTEFVIIPDVFMPIIEDLKYLPAKQFIFPSPLDQSKPIGRNSMYRKHKKILDELGYGEGYTLYSWKHTGAVSAAKAGISVKELQIQLRHHSLDMTDRYLRQMGVKDLSRLAERFPKL